MVEYYTIFLIALALIVLAVIIYICFKRVCTKLSDFDRSRRLTYWRPKVNEWLKDESQQFDRETLIKKSGRDIKIITELCVEELQKNDENIRSRLVQILEKHGYIEQCINKVSSSNRWERARAIEALGLLRTHDAESVLVAALEDPVFDVRIRAAKALGLLGGKRARHALVSVLGDEGRWSVIRIADILGQMGALITNDLIAAFPGLGRASKLAALDVVIRLSNVSHLQFLLSCVTDDDAEVRSRAVSGLGRIGNVTALPKLLLALHDREWPVRAKAAKALGDLSLMHAIPNLLECLSDHEWWVRYNAAESLSRLGEEGIDALFDGLSSNDAFCRDQAFSRLQSSGALTERLEGILSNIPEVVSRTQNLAARLIDHLTEQGFIDFCESQPRPEVRVQLWDMYKRYSKYLEGAA